MAARDIYGTILSTATYDVPAAAGTAQEVDLISTDALKNSVAAISGYCSEAFMFCFAASASAAATALGSVGTRGFRPAGAFLIDAKNLGKNFYFRCLTGGAVSQAAATSKGMSIEVIGG